jgi:hypothetical protein
MQHAGRGSLNLTVTEFDDYYVAFGNLNVHETNLDGSTACSFRIQVYMSVNKSTWELTHVICFATLHTSLDWDAGWQRRGIPAGWGIFQNKRNPDLYLAHQYCGYFCARFPSAWRCIAWFILFKMRNLNLHWWTGTFAGASVIVQIQAGANICAWQEADIWTLSTYLSFLWTNIMFPPE